MWLRAFTALWLVPAPAAHYAAAAGLGARPAIAHGGPSLAKPVAHPQSSLLQPTSGSSGQPASVRISCTPGPRLLPCCGGP